ncbi:hypothetical protein MKW98_011824 [Papaver atlanticum]|uniref:Uncharacterized protein n=1 Tax=Papaver atlanticum TaxID=357466 RepID=A0AAD4SMW5_9MAGN|nr:hypothetical protein MKW98_011824 [Papaver atlanticum]
MLTSDGRLRTETGSFGVWVKITDSLFCGGSRENCVTELILHSQKRNSRIQLFNGFCSNASFRVMQV